MYIDVPGCKSNDIRRIETASDPHSLQDDQVVVLSAC